MAPRKSKSLDINFSVTVIAVYISGESSWTIVEPLVFESKYPKQSRIPETPTSLEGTSWPIYVLLSNGKIDGADFVVSATGVSPNTSIFPGHLLRSEDGGIAVDENCKVVSCDNLYAVGDCASMKSDSPHWFQMRLWSQARVMGLHAGRVMVGYSDELGGGFNFEIFTHVTFFFGYRVILLGLYNGQTLPLDIQDEIKNRVVRSSGVIERREGEGSSDSMVVAADDITAKLGALDVQVYVRVTPGEEYIKVIVYRGKLVGAILIGDTDLEEAFENVIMSGVDVSHLGVDILHPDFDAEDYFD